MGDDASAAVGLLVAEVLVLAVFVWLPVMGGERAFFGVRVDAETYRGEGRRALLRYRQTLCGVFVLKRDLVQAKMTLPATNTEEYLRGKERFLTANMRLIDMVRAVMGATLLAVAWLTVCTSLPEFKPYETFAQAAVLSTAGLMVAGMGYFIWRMVTINRGPDELTGEE